MTVKYPQLQDEHWLRRKYVTDARTMADIANELGTSSGNVLRALRRMGIRTRGRENSDDWEPISCSRCNETFKPTTWTQKYCDTRCRQGWGACLSCGVEFVNSGHGKMNVYCSTKCHYAHARDTGKQGRYLTTGGYIEAWVPPETPGRDGRGRMKEHRYVMQQSLGRPLLLTETVHHVNGDKVDNRVENLQLRQGHHNKGVVMVCNSCGSHDVSSRALT